MGENLVPTSDQAWAFPPVPETDEERPLVAWRETLLRRWVELEKSFRQRLANQREVIDNLDKARLEAQQERNRAESRNAELVLELAQRRQYWEEHGQGFRDAVTQLAMSWVRLADSHEAEGREPERVAHVQALRECSREVLGLLGT